MRERAFDLGNEVLGISDISYAGVSATNGSKGAFRFLEIGCRAEFEGLMMGLLGEEWFLFIDFGDVKK